jgi:hypothetical protein
MNYQGEGGMCQENFSTALNTMLRLFVDRYAVRHDIDSS